MQVNVGRSWEIPAWYDGVENDHALADAIVSLVHEPERADTMGTAALEQVSSLFSPDVFRRSGESFLRMLEAELLRAD